MSDSTQDVARDDAQACCASGAQATQGGEVSASRSAVDREIDGLEAEIGQLQGRLARLRARRPRVKVEDYVFQAWSGGEARLSDLFGDRRDLLFVHNMGRSCNYCTMWADGLNGLLPHLLDRAAFWVGSPDPVEAQQEFAAGRGWRFPMVSFGGSRFNGDMGFVDRDGDPMPGVTAFTRDRDGSILAVQRAEFGPGDQFCATWHLFDLLADGTGDWEPHARYRT